MLFQVCPMSREAFLEIIPIGEIQEFLFDSRDPSRNMEPIQTMLAFLPKPGAYHSSQSVFAIRQDPQIRVLSSTAAPENGLHPPLCIRIQVPHHGECLAAALRGLDAPGENLKLMPLARPSMPRFNECAIDSHHHSLSRFGDNTGVIDFPADLFFNAFTDSERSVACRGII
jgi:hypothetical protein